MNQTIKIPTEVVNTAWMTTGDLMKKCDTLQENTMAYLQTVMTTGMILSFIFGVVATITFIYLWKRLDK